MPDEKMEATGAGKVGFQVDRLAFFSDAIFAIAITLLALEIHPAQRTYTQDESGLRAALLSMVPKIIGFFVSFAVIGTYWRAHHRLFRRVRDCNAKLVSINMRLLLAVSFVPCPTAFYSSYPGYQTPLIFYTVGLALVGLAYHSLCRYVAGQPQLLDPQTPEFEIRLMGQRSLIIPTACLLAALFSLFSLWLSGLTLMAIPLAVELYTRFAHRRAGKLRPE